MANMNGAPKVEWIRSMTSCDGLTIHNLYVNGNETPYFVTTANTIGHRTDGEKYGLYGAGMKASRIPGRNIAATLDCGPRIAVLKHRAEQMAMDAA